MSYSVNSRSLGSFRLLSSAFFYDVTVIDKCDRETAALVDFGANTRASYNYRETCTKTEAGTPTCSLKSFQKVWRYWCESRVIDTIMRLYYPYPAVISSRLFLNWRNVSYMNSDICSRFQSTTYITGHVANIFNHAHVVVQ